MNLRDLFIDKSKTLIVNTDLALVLGDLNEAIILNQLNYWLESNKKADKNFIDGVYDNSTSGLTATTIQGAIDELKSLIDGLTGLD